MPPPPAEELIWKGSPSQLTRFGTHLLCLLLSAGLLVLGWMTQPLLALSALVPLLFMAWTWFVIRCRTYEITTERIKMGQGVLTRTVHELELYRVRDTTLVQPLFYRLFGKGNVVLNTSDATTPVVVLECIAGAADIREKLRSAIEACRERKRVRYAELGGDVETDAPPPPPG